MVLGYGELFTKVKMVYYSHFSPELVTPALEPKVAATSDTNFFNWWRERDYYWLETVRLVWRNPENDKLWLSRNIAIFKRKGLSRFKFQAGGDVPRTDTFEQVIKKWYAFMRSSRIRIM